MGYVENLEMSTSDERKKNHRKTSDEKKSSKLKQHFQKLTPSEVCTSRVQELAEMEPDVHRSKMINCAYVLRRPSD